MSKKKDIFMINTIIADDNVEFRTLIKDWLIFLEDDLSIKFNIEEAEDGQEAIDLFDKYLNNENGIQLAIVDYIMPKVDGKDVIKYIVETHPIPIIALSGDIRSKGLDFVKEGALMFLPKPFEIEAFKKAIETAKDLSSIDTVITFAEETIDKIEDILKIKLDLNDKNIKS